jgi:hypothetical protein
MLRSGMITACLCAIVATATSVAQTNTSFSIVNSNDGAGPNAFWDPTNIYAVDVNNDGIPDLIQDIKRSGSNNSVGVFGVSIANGDGTFKPAVAYSYPSGVLQAPMTFGDFNHDGRVDIALTAPGKKYLAVYFGNGNGTFQAPKLSTIPLSAGQSMAASPLVAADFNRDGKLDLAIVGSDTTNTTVYILPGNNTGSFSTAHPIFTAPTAQSVWGSSVHNFVLGDFDADGNADMALTTTTSNQATGDVSSTTIHVFYGEGNFLFTDTTPFHIASQIEMNSGDLNSDGRTDLFAYDMNNYRLDTFYAQSGRTFATYTESIPHTSYQFSQYMPALTMADFNGNGRMDLVTTVAPAGKISEIFFLATTSRGQFTAQTWKVSTYQSTTDNTQAVVGDFNRDNKPDFAMVQSWASSTIHTGLNKTAGGNWGSCPYPHKGQGIALCSPGSSPGNPVNFSAAARSFGELRKMEVWVDGKKLVEQHHAWDGYAYLNFKSTVAAGTHKGSIVAADVDNTLHKYPFTFTVK